MLNIKEHTRNRYVLPDDIEPKNIFSHTCINNAIDKNVITCSFTLTFVQQSNHEMCVILLYTKAVRPSFFGETILDLLDVLRGYRMDTSTRHIRGCYLPRGERVGSSFISQMLRARVIRCDDYRFETVSASVSWKGLFLCANNRQTRVYVGCNGGALQGIRRHSGHS